MMKYDKIVRNLDILKDWGISGLYREFSPERTFCSCGEVFPNKIYICPKCGNTDFAPINGYQGRIKSRSNEHLILSPVSMEIQVEMEYLFIKRNPVEPAYMDLAVSKGYETILIGRRGNHNISDEDILDFMAKYQDLYPEDVQQAINVVEKLKDADYKVPIESLMNPLVKGFPHWVSFANECFKKKQENFLVYSIKAVETTYNVNWVNTIDEMINQLSIPKCFHKELNDPKMLKLLSRCSPDNVRSFEEKWPQLPIDMQGALINYFKTGLITQEQFMKLYVISLELLKQSPEAQMRFLKKYFANCHISNWQNPGLVTADDVFAFYEDRGLPITAESFDLRAYHSIKNGDRILELGLPAKEIQKIMDDMDVSPLDSIIEMSKLRRPRGSSKSTP